jgi:hypothetical protein
VDREIQPHSQHFTSFITYILASLIVFVSSFKNILMFVVKAKRLLKSGAPGALAMYFTPVGFGLTRKHKTSLEKPARSKH